MTITSRRALQTLALLLLAAVLLLLSPAAHAAPHARDGVCSGSEGVTVIVDLNPSDDSAPGAPVHARCVIGVPADGFEALDRAGFAYESIIDPTWGPQLCSLEGLGGTCDPASSAYWSFWIEEAGGWGYATTGLGGYSPTPGSVIGLRWVLDWMDPLDDQMPRMIPHPVAIDEVPTQRAGSDVSVGFAAPGTSTVRCRVDQSWWTTCTSAGSHTIRNLAIGSHTLYVRATSATGITAIAQRTFDVMPTAATISGVSHDVTSASTATVTATINAGSGAQRAHVEYAVGTDHANAISTAARTVAAGATSKLDFGLRGLTSDTAFSYRVVTNRAAGTVTSPWTTFTTPRRATSLTIRREAGSFIRRGTRISFVVDRLDPKERVTIAIGDRTLATRRADEAGIAHVRVHIPGTVRTGRTELRVTGSAATRTGVLPVTVTTTARFTVTPKLRTVRTRASARITARGFAAGEQVTVRFRGRIVADGAANARGRFSARVPVGTRPGRYRVRIIGSHGTRTGVATIRVLARR